MAVKRCRWRTNFNKAMRRCSVIARNATRTISQHICTCAVNHDNDNDNDNDQRECVVDQSRVNDMLAFKMIDSSTGGVVTGLEFKTSNPCIYMRGYYDLLYVLASWRYWNSQIVCQQQPLFKLLV